LSDLIYIDLLFKLFEFTIVTKYKINNLLYYAFIEY